MNICNMISHLCLHRHGFLFVPHLLCLSPRSIFSHCVPGPAQTWSASAKLCNSSNLRRPPIGRSAFHWRGVARLYSHAIGVQSRRACRLISFTKSTGGASLPTCDDVSVYTGEHMSPLRKCEQGRDAAALAEGREVRLLTNTH